MDFRKSDSLLRRTCISLYGKFSISKSVFIGFAWLFIIPLQAQSDTLLLSFEDYLQLVRDHHPVMYQAKLLENLGESALLMARGGFDPKLEASYDQKSFEGKNYYRMLGSALKLPTWLGVDLKAGFDHYRGEYLNEMDFIPDPGLWNLGVSVPLGKGLIIDDRRAELKKAKVFSQSMVQEQIILINDLLFSAVTAFFDWQEKYQFLLIAEEGVQLARERLAGTVISFEEGDKPAIDTLESFLSLQSRQQSLIQAEQSLANALIELQKYLWLNGELPLELDPLTIPASINNTTLEEDFDQLVLREEELVLNHPLINVYNLKLEQLDIDIRLNKEALKPDLRVDYFPIARAGADIFNNFSTNNYKIGASFQYPLLQRKARGKLRQNELKFQDTQYELSQKQRDLQLKLNNYRYNTDNQLLQWEMAQEIVENYRSLLVAENRRFSIGESSVFLVNSREISYLESRRKEVESLMKLLKNRLTYLYIGAQTGNL